MTDEKDFDEIAAQLFSLLSQYPNGKAVKEALEFYLNHFDWDYDRRKISPYRFLTQKEKQDD